jgi:hypothetical protein
MLRFSSPKLTFGREVRGTGRQNVDLDDRFARAVSSELREPHLTGARVVVQVEADLVAIEGDGPVNVADRNHNHFERPIHQSLFRSSSSFS